MSTCLRKISCISFVLILGLMIACGNREDRTIAKVGDRSITLGKFEEEFKKGKAKNILEAATDSMKLDHLNRMVDKELKILAAYDQKLDQDSSLVTRMKSREENEVGRKVWQTEVLDKVMPESEIHEFYINSQKEVRVRDILLRATDKDSAEHHEQVKQKIDKLYKDAKSGAKFDSLARRYSQDRGTAPKGGDRGFLKWDPVVSSNEIYRIAFKMDEGDISKPFKMNNGYHIVKVEEIKAKAPAGTYEKMKDKIINGLMRSRRKEMQEKMDGYTEELKEKYKGKIQSENAKSIIAKLKAAKATPDSLEDQQRMRAPVGPNDFSVLTEADMNLALFEFDGGEITAGKIVNEVKRYPPYKQPDFTDEKNLNQYLDRMILVKLFVHEGYRRGYDKDEEVEKLLTDQIENAIHRTIYQKEILQSVKPSEDELKAYYEAHQKKYMNPELREIQEMWIKDDRAKAEMALNAVKKLKRDFSSVAGKYNERAATKKKNGMLGFIRKVQYGDVGKKAFEMKVGEISDIITMGRNFSILTVLSIKEPAMKTYAEVKSQVRNEVTSLQRKNTEKEWMESLRKKFKVVIYGNILHDACKIAD